MSKYRYLIIDEDRTTTGTDDEALAMDFGMEPCATVVVDTEDGKIYFEGDVQDLPKHIPYAGREDEEQDGSDGVAEREG